MSSSVTTPKDLRRLKSTWERLGRDDPMWAVLTERENWDENEFFATGAREVAEAMEYVESMGLDIGRDRALDFGCGLGRLTRALGVHFRLVVGVDVASSMIEAAQRLNQDCSNCDFRRNSSQDLSLFESGSFDLVYSRITLQHMAPEFAKAYLSEFLRVVAEDGLVLFQFIGGRRHATLADRAESARRKIRRLRHTPVRGSKLIVQHLLRRKMEMHWIPRDEVVAHLEAAGGKVIDVRPDGAAGPLFESYTYAVVAGLNRGSVSG